MEEIEIKYWLEGPAEHERLRAALAALGARPAPARVEEDVLFDTAGRDLATRQSVLRLRTIDGGPGGKLTFKGPAHFSDGVKTRQEVEVGVSDAASTHTLLEALDYRETLSYTKQREIWRLDSAEVCLDSLDVGSFCEIEGPRDAILHLGRRLGLDPTRAERASYPELIARRLTGQPGD